MTIRPFLCAASLVLCLHQQLAAQHGGELRLGGVSMSTDRNAVEGAGVSRASGTLSGGELLARTDAVGLYVRLFQGDFAASQGATAQGRLLIGDARLLLGTRKLGLDLGYSRRAQGTQFSRGDLELARAGLRTNIRLGSSGLFAMLSAGGFVSINFDKGVNDNVRFIGGDAETQLMYALPHGLPLYVALGYRFERLDNGGNTFTDPEELSGVILMGGLRLGNR